MSFDIEMRMKCTPEIKGFNAFSNEFYVSATNDNTLSQKIDNIVNDLSSDKTSLFGITYIDLINHYPEIEKLKQSRMYYMSLFWFLGHIREKTTSALFSPAYINELIFDYTNKIRITENGITYIVIDQVDIDNHTYLYLINRDDENKTRVVEIVNDKLKDINLSVLRNKIIRTLTILENEGIRIRMPRGRIASINHYPDIEKSGCSHKNDEGLNFLLSSSQPSFAGYLLKDILKRQH